MITNVLFVNIGWAERYDGTEGLVGDHGWINDHNGDPQQVSEGRAFSPDEYGAVRCGVGDGNVSASSDSTDVVFVAKNPSRSIYETVGIYRRPSWRFVYPLSRNGKVRKFGIAETKEFHLLPLQERPIVPWNAGRSMRRWACESGIIRYPQFMGIYNEVLRTLS